MIHLAAALLLSQAVVSTPPPVPPPSPLCASAGHHGFDFWVGEWNVYPNAKDSAKAPLTAHSRIERLYDGCAIRENWMPLKGGDGGSLNSYDPSTGQWRQLWLDSQGGQVHFDGGLAGQSMVLTGFWRGVNGPGQDGLIRMTYTPLDPDSVRQHGEISTDQGLTWSDSFDLIYRRAKTKR